MVESRPFVTPLLEGITLSTKMSTASIDSIAYSHLVGKLIYLTKTCLDISYVMGIVSCYMVSPQQLHQDAVHHILRYLWHIPDHGLLYQQRLSQAPS